MSLKLQIISLIFSFFYGIFLSLAINLNYKVLFSSKAVFKIIANIFFCLDMVLIYFIIMKKINNAIIHPFFYLLIFIGFIASFKKSSKIRPKSVKESKDLVTLLKKKQKNSII